MGNSRAEHSTGIDAGRGMVLASVETLVLDGNIGSDIDIDTDGCAGYDFSTAATAFSKFNKRRDIPSARGASR